MTVAPPPTIAPYGAWASPITAERVVRQAAEVQEISTDAAALDGGAGALTGVYWLETRPREDGRGVIVRYGAEGRIVDRTPAGYSARSRVHEYGGGAFCVYAGVIYFVNESDQRIYAQAPGDPPRPLTPPDARRYADLIVDAKRSRLIAVCEDHRGVAEGSRPEPAASLVAVPMSGGHEPQALYAGNDFYAAPRLSPDGDRLAWLSWDHPNMPWDRSDLWWASVRENGGIAERARVAGGPEEAVAHPAWSPGGVLYFASDRAGWWNLYRATDQGPRVVHRSPHDFAHPHWVFGEASYAFLSEQRIICSFTTAGSWRLAVLSTESGLLRTLQAPFGEIHQLRATRGGVVFLGGAPDRAMTVVGFDGSGRFLDLRPSPSEEPPPEEPRPDGTQSEAPQSQEPQFEERQSEENQPQDPLAPFFSEPEPITFPSTDDANAHAFFYAPRNPNFRAPPHERPPLIVRSHGGPTSATSNTLRLEIQYWTSRGFALVDVNYRGSSGYGRAYRNALRGRWGLVDVEDCIAAARYLVNRGDVDSGRLAIAGRSAGGFTTLAALTFHNVFAAGASSYGISDLEALALDTHKFESRYLDGLLAPYRERPALYRARSPLYHVPALNTPMIFFQGSEDRVVPPEQTRRIVEALRERGVPVASLEFAGERHGFRQTANRVRALEAELSFYGQVLGFTPAGAIPPVSITPAPER